MNTQNQYNMSQDIKSNFDLTQKIKNSQSYAQNMYAAMCNNNFVKISEQNNYSWSCSWRSSGRTIADIRGDGTDYADWYCSGMAEMGALAVCGYVPESYITEEIADDLYKIGWRATRDE